MHSNHSLEVKGYKGTEEDDNIEKLQQSLPNSFSMSLIINQVLSNCKCIQVIPCRCYMYINNRNKELLNKVNSKRIHNETSPSILPPLQYKPSTFSQQMHLNHSLHSFENTVHSIGCMNLQPAPLCPTPCGEILKQK